ncbi:MAG: helix-turn-helix domain-containing protein [Candidatus Aminicenantes bacterium]|nr:helix-turn-helix domain-containing protein [Candidatus Aminicenantes bacterium]
MKKRKKKEYLSILELGEKASRDDIENAYSHFVKLYSSEYSPEIHPLKEEIPKEERKKILSDIDKAYKALVGEDGVNRIDFSAEFEPQEIILDEGEGAAIEHVKIEPSKEVQEESEPVVEFEFTDETIQKIPVDESIDDINEKNELIVEIPESEKEYNEIPDEIEHQVIEMDEDIPDEDEEMEGSIEEEPEISEPQVIEFEEDLPDENVDMDGSIEEGPEIIVQEEVVVDKDPVDADVEITGKYLKKIRESRKLKVRDIGEILNIEYKSIVHIENEKFEKLNDPGFLRWLIKSYSKFLGLNEEKSAGDYMRRYRSKK